jgi:hypothetical protein
VLLSDGCDRLSAKVDVLLKQKYAELTSPLFAFTEFRGTTKFTMLPHQISAKRFQTAQPVISKFGQICRRLVFTGSVYVEGN